MFNELLFKMEVQKFVEIKTSCEVFICNSSAAKTLVFLGE